MCDPKIGWMENSLLIRVFIIFNIFIDFQHYQGVELFKIKTKLWNQNFQNILIIQKVIAEPTMVLWSICDI
jgi:hypothetical protein